VLVSVSVPEFVFVKDPVVAVLVAPGILNITPDGTSIVPVVPALIVMARSVEAVDPVYCSVPPANTKLAAAFVACPKLPATPPLPIVATLVIPLPNVVTPVYVFVPDSVNVPVPVFVRETVPEPF
jgi:hypothetical protein